MSNRSASNRTAGNRFGGDGSFGRKICTQDVVSAWMIYLVFLGGLLLLSTFYLQDGPKEVLNPDVRSPDLAMQDGAGVVGKGPGPIFAMGRA